MTADQVERLYINNKTTPISGVLGAQRRALLRAHRQQLQSSQAPETCRVESPQTPVAGLDESATDHQTRVYAFLFSVPFLVCVQDRGARLCLMCRSLGEVLRPPLVGMCAHMNVCAGRGVKLRR